MSVSAALQKAIYDALVADVDVGALIGDRIYDRMPSIGTFPCATFGPTQQLEDDADCITGEEHFIQLDCWSEDQGRLIGCKRIVDAVKAALHGAALSLPDPYALAFMRVTDARVFLDSDGTTAHGVLTVQAVVEL